MLYHFDGRTMEDGVLKAGSSAMANARLQHSILLSPTGF